MVLAAGKTHPGLRKRGPSKIFLWASESAAETLKFGRLIGRMAYPSLVIAISGPVGAGKTTLVKGIAAAMRIKPEDVQSPSFVLIREYRGPRLWLFHADFYRVGQEQAVRFLGLEEYVTPRGVLAIEWPCGMGQLTADYLDVRLRIASRTRRIISVRGRGLRPQALQRTLTQTVPRRTRVSA